MFTLKIRRDPSGEGDPGSELWIADVSLVSKIGKRTRADVLNGCWSGYHDMLRDYGQALYVPAVRPAGELRVGDSIWLDGDTVQVDGSPCPTGIWAVRRCSPFAVTQGGVTEPQKVSVQIVNDDETVAYTIQLLGEQLVSASPLVPNTSTMLTLLYVEHARRDDCYWCIVETAWLLGPDGQTIERIAP